MYLLRINEMRNLDVTKVDREDLVDIQEVTVNKNLKQSQRLVDFVRQIKNPYCYRHGEYIVKIGFEDTEVTLTERLKELILKTANAT